MTVSIATPASGGFTPTGGGRGVPVTSAGGLRQVSGLGVAPPKKPKQPSAESLRLSSVISKLLLQIAEGKYKGATAEQTEAAKRAFTSSYVDALMATPKDARTYVEHPGISDYYATVVRSSLAPSWTEKTAGQVKQHAENIAESYRAHWARTAEQSPYVTYPAGGVGAGQRNIAPYLEAGGWVSSYEYLAENPQYAIDFYESDPARAEQLMANMYIPGVGITYGGINERVRALQARAYANLEIAQARHIKPPWMQMPETPVGTLPPWVQATQGMTEPRW